jgi:hypothetical protein
MYKENYYNNYECSFPEFIAFEIYHFFLTADAAMTNPNSPMTIHMNEDILHVFVAESHDWINPKHWLLHASIVWFVPVPPHPEIDV